MKTPKHTQSLVMNAKSANVFLFTSGQTARIHGTDERGNSYSATMKAEDALELIAARKKATI